jgi:hypothetical protein
MVADEKEVVPMVQTSQSVQVDARPFPLAIDPWETAVIVVDMQQGFFGAGVHRWHHQYLRGIHATRRLFPGLSLPPAD